MPRRGHFNRGSGPPWICRQVVQDIWGVSSAFLFCKKMAAKKRSRPTYKGASNSDQALEALKRLPIVFSTATSSVVNMLVVAVTSASVLLCLFAAKRIF